MKSLGHEPNPGILNFKSNFWETNSWSSSSTRISSQGTTQISDSFSARLLTKYVLANKFLFVGTQSCVLPAVRNLQPRVSVRLSIMDTDVVNIRYWCMGHNHTQILISCGVSRMGPLGNLKQICIMINDKKYFVFFIRTPVFASNFLFHDSCFLLWTLQSICMIIWFGDTIVRARH